MYKLSLKVLLTFLALMFSASVGLSAVYECRFYARTQPDPTSGLMSIDTKQGTVTITSSNAWLSENEKGPHKVTISDNGSKFSWTYRGYVKTSTQYSSPEKLSVEIELNSLSDPVKAVITVENANGLKWPGRERYLRNAGICKILTSRLTNARVNEQSKTKSLELAKYECKFRPPAYYRGPTNHGHLKIDPEAQTVTISNNLWSNGNINHSHKLKVNESGNFYTWSFAAYGKVWHNKLRLESSSAETIAYLNNNEGICKLLQPNVVSAVSTSSESESTKPSTPDALEAVFLTQQAFDRRNIQLILSDLSFYKSTIDGLYGSGTEGALYAYNDEYFRGSDLTKEDNVNALFEDILSQRVVEVEEPASLDNLIEQIDDIVGGELEPGEVELSK